MISIYNILCYEESIKMATWIYIAEISSVNDNKFVTKMICVPYFILQI